MNDRNPYNLERRLNQLSHKFKQTTDRAAQIPEDRPLKVVVVQEQMRKSISTAAQNRIRCSLKQLRLAYGLSYADLQERTGLPQQLFWDLEYNEKRLTLSELQKIASCYQLSTSEILGVDID